MTPTETKWLRVNRSMRCPVCEKPDWCTIAADKTVCICMRVESAKRTRNGGYLHTLTDAPRPRALPRLIITTKSAPPDLTALALQYRDDATVDEVRTFAAHLHVRTDSMLAFGVGWAADCLAWSFPMRDPMTGKVTGIRLRRPDGGKFSIRGGRESLFLPDTLTTDDEVLLVTEGVTDAISAHGIGFLNVVGRPSCTGGTAHLVALVRARKPARLVIVRDNDEPGIRGADALASALALYARDVRVISPPDRVKDVRDWVATGAGRADVERIIAAADVRRLNLTITTKGTK